MGNQIVCPIGQSWFQDDLSFLNFQTIRNISDGTFSLSFKAKNLSKNNEFVVIKAYKIKENKQIKEIIDIYYKIFSDIEKIPQNKIYGNLFSSPFKSKIGAYLVRNYLDGIPLPERIVMDPPLNYWEKKWISYQIFKAVLNLGKNGLFHGDIKPENVFVSDSLYVQLVDHSPFKPETIGANQPHYLIHFFSCYRSCCYLAPERINSSSNNNGNNINSINGNNNISSTNSPVKFSNTKRINHVSADVFSAACVVAYLYTNGEDLFDFYSIQEFKNDNQNARKKIDLIGDEEIKKLVWSLLVVDPEKRLENFSKFEEYFPRLFSNSYDSFCSTVIEARPQAVLGSAPHFLEEVERKLGEKANSSSFDGIAQAVSAANIFSSPDKNNNNVFNVWQNNNNKIKNNQNNMENDDQNNINSNQSNINSNQNIMNNLKNTLNESSEMSLSEEQDDNDVCLIFVVFISASFSQTNTICSLVYLIDYFLEFSLHLSDPILKLTRVIPPLIVLLGTSGCTTISVHCFDAIADVLKSIDLVPQNIGNYATEYLIPHLRRAMKGCWASQFISRLPRFIYVLANLWPTLLQNSYFVNGKEIKKNAFSFINEFMDDYSAIKIFAKEAADTALLEYTLVDIDDGRLNGQQEITKNNIKYLKRRGVDMYSIFSCFSCYIEEIMKIGSLREGANFYLMFLQRFRPKDILRFMQNDSLSNVSFFIKFLSSKNNSEASIAMDFLREFLVISQKFAPSNVLSLIASAALPHLFNRTDDCVCTSAKQILKLLHEPFSIFSSALWVRSSIELPERNVRTPKTILIESPHKNGNDLLQNSNSKDISNNTNSNSNDNNYGINTNDFLNSYSSMKNYCNSSDVYNYMNNNCDLNSSSIKKKRKNKSKTISYKVSSKKHYDTYKASGKKEIGGYDYSRIESVEIATKLLMMKSNKETTKSFFIYSEKIFDEQVSKLFIMGESPNLSADSFVFQHSDSLISSYTIKKMNSPSSTNHLISENKSPKFVEIKSLDFKGKISFMNKLNKTDFLVTSNELKKTYVNSGNDLNIKSFFNSFDKILYQKKLNENNLILNISNNHMKDCDSEFCRNYKAEIRDLEHSFDISSKIDISFECPNSPKSIIVNNDLSSLSGLSCCQTWSDLPMFAVGNNINNMVSFFDMRIKLPVFSLYSDLCPLDIITFPLNELRFGIVTQDGIDFFDPRFLGQSPTFSEAKSKVSNDIFSAPNFSSMKSSYRKEEKFDEFYQRIKKKKDGVRNYFDPNSSPSSIVGNGLYFKLNGYSRNIINYFSNLLLVDSNGTFIVDPNGNQTVKALFDNSFSFPLKAIKKTTLKNIEPVCQVGENGHNCVSLENENNEFIRKQTSFGGEPGVPLYELPTTIKRSLHSHLFDVTSVDYNKSTGVCCSGDANGFVHIWCPSHRNFVCKNILIE